MQLPEVSHKDLLIWDNRRAECAGYLNKKASQNSSFSKGKWQKRWFLINIDIGNDENYTLDYFHSPDDKKPSQSYHLAYATIKVSSGTSFVITLHDNTALTLSAETIEVMNDWVETIENVVSVSNLREKLLDQHGAASDGSANDNPSSSKGGNAARSNSPVKRGVPPATPTAQSYLTNKANTTKAYRRQAASKFTPSVRLDIDINSIPPSSTSRHQFKECFVADVAKYLEITPDMVEVVSIRPAPGVDWLTLVDFDICVYASPHDEVDNEDAEYQEALAQERQQIRHRLLFALHDMVQDTSCALYNGLITSKLDPSYCNHIVERGSRGANDETALFSSDASVLSIMNKYKDTQVPAGTVDISHFTILLCFEGKVHPMLVPNPMVLSKRCCAIWPFEVKQLLGFIGNMQELWVEPTGLIPRDLPKSLTQPILFEPSCRMQGARIISATRLQADLSYDVQVEDRREEALNALSKEEMDSIKETFQRYDINGDGGISKLEMEELVRIRTQERMHTIEEKFNAYVAEASVDGISEAEMTNAENNKAQYLQQVHEAQTKLLHMFEAADTNGDGVISFTEFIMAEAWWLRCTINPEKAHLF